MRAQHSCTARHFLARTAMAGTSTTKRSRHSGELSLLCFSIESLGGCAAGPKRHKRCPCLHSSDVGLLAPMGESQGYL